MDVLSSAIHTATTSITIHGIPCHTLSDNEIRPSRRDKSNIAVYSDTVGGFITSGDTVRIYTSNHKMLIGQIIKVSTQFPSGTHPLITNYDYDDIMVDNAPEQLFMHIHLYLPREDTTFNNDQNILPQQEPSVAQLGLNEVVQTNVGFWISPEKIHSGVFVIHEKDCIQQKYGSVNGRDNTFYVRLRVKLSLARTRGGLVTLDSVTRLSRRDYKQFGANTGIKSRVVTITEQRLQSISTMWSNSQRLLHAAGHEATIAKSTTDTMSRQAWIFLVGRICSTIPITITETRATQRVLNPNYSVTTHLVTKYVEVITIKTQQGFDSIRRLVSNQIGISPRINNPSHAQTFHGNDTTPLCETDEINLMPQALNPPHEDEEGVEAVNFERYIRFRYHHSTSKMTTTIKSMVVIANPNDDRIQRLIARGAVVNEWVQPQFPVGHFFEWNDDEYQVDQVINNATEIVAHLRDDINTVIRLTMEQFTEAIQEE